MEKLDQNSPGRLGAEKQFSNSMMHLTNYSINKKFPNPKEIHAGSILYKIHRLEISKLTNLNGKKNLNIFESLGGKANGYIAASSDCAGIQHIDQHKQCK